MASLVRFGRTCAARKLSVPSGTSRVNMIQSGLMTKPASRSPA